jgi:hypothetical protein
MLELAHMVDQLWSSCYIARLSRGAAVLLHCKSLLTHTKKRALEDQPEVHRHKDDEVQVVRGHNKGQQVGKVIQCYQAKFRSDL